MRASAAFGTLILCLVGAAQAQPTEKGEYLARTANCVACHSIADGPAFAGGLKMGTPLGAIYATNITPDAETGIGSYTLADFDRALRRGVAKDGHHLYPAMPYPSYAKLSDEDVSALYDYFMKSVKPVRQPNRPSEIKWPLNLRWPLAVWNALFLDRAAFKPKAGADVAWNRGAYLVQGAGHCGACHTARGLAWQEKALDETGNAYLSGAELDYWTASDLTGDPKLGLGRWSEPEIASFLKTGHNVWGAAYGSMGEVINNSTAFLTDDDLTAMAKYLKSLKPAGRDRGAPYAYDASTAEKLRAPHPDQPGAILYLQQCAACHVEDGKGRGLYMPPLAGNPTVLDDQAASLINIILNGSMRLVAQGDPDAYRMPQYRVLLNDRQIADLASFVRAAWGNDGAPISPDKVSEIRRRTDPASDQVVILKMR